jgi:hypothetical protein
MTGLAVTDPQSGAVSVFQNVVRDTTDDGIFFGSDTRGNVVRGNNSQGSGGFDCRDDSALTPSTVMNGWLNNIGVTSSPPGLCKPPA